MKKEFAIMGVLEHEFEFILSLGRAAHTGFTNASGNYVTPVVPMSTLLSSCDALDAAITAWGRKQTAALSRRIWI